jgi:hypothetical protein
MVVSVPTITEVVIEVTPWCHAVVAAGQPSR